MSPRTRAREWCLVVSWLCVAAGCGRLGFAPAPDAAASDAGLDAQLVDASADSGARADAGVDAPTDAACTPLVSSCDRIPMYPTAPVLDGLLDPCLDTFDVTPQGWTGAAPMPAVTARAALAWRPNAVYVYVEVHDPDLHPAAMSDPAGCGDAVELYVDADGTFTTPGAYDVPGTIALVMQAPSSPTGHATSGEWYQAGGASGHWSTAHAWMIGRDFGYSIDVLVEASDLMVSGWAPSAGGSFGIDIGVDVSTPDGSPTTRPGECGVRAGRFFLRVVPPAGGLCGNPSCDTRAFCTGTLL
jgi:hypothetical protein